VMQVIKLRKKWVKFDERKRRWVLTPAGREALKETT
jgi:hypothetical protein